MIKFFKRIDQPLLFAVLFLALLGLSLIFSASLKIDPWSFFIRQSIYFLIGMVLLFFTIRFDFERLASLFLPAYLLILSLLFLVFLLGFSSLGAQRWINLGIFSFQPSEVVKLLLIIVLASYISDKSRRLASLFDFFKIFLLVLIPFFLTFKQPDLGTSLVFWAIAFGMLLFNGRNLTLFFLILTPLVSLALSSFFYFWLGYILLLVLFLKFKKGRFLDSLIIFGLNVIVGVSLPFFYSLLTDYQKSRILNFLNPAADPLGAGYHALQSKIAIGAGGLLGEGFLHGTQTQHGFIPLQYTDFIFSVAGEELGFLGAMTILILFAVVIFRGLKIAFETKSQFGGLLAAGIVMMFTFHLLVNVSMTVGMAPVVGLPLPFLSFGGTSLIVSLVSIGLLESIAYRRRRIEF